MYFNKVWGQDNRVTFSFWVDGGRHSIISQENECKASKWSRAAVGSKSAGSLIFGTSACVGSLGKVQCTIIDWIFLQTYYEFS